MSTEVSTVMQFSEADLALIRDTVARGASPSEFQLFLARCKLLGLNPLKPGQIHFVKYGSGPGTIVVGIEGFRSIAGRTGKLSGIRRGAIRDEKGALIGGWAEVFRSDWQHPAREEAPFAEYNKGKGPWQTMPETMIKKVAEAAALRMAFPDDLGGVYAPEEMDQAAGRVVAEQPSDGDGFRGHSDGRYRFDFGGSELRGKTIEQVFKESGPEKMEAYADKLEARESLSDAQRIGMERIREFLDALGEAQGQMGAE